MHTDPLRLTNNQALHLLQLITALRAPILSKSLRLPNLVRSRPLTLLHLFLFINTLTSKHNNKNNNNNTCNRNYP